MRSASIERVTKETDIVLRLDLDRGQPSRIATESRMFDHLLTAWVFHASIGCEIEATSFDGLQHHLVEDVAIVIGKAMAEALGTRAGIARYGEATIAMDDALVRCVVDFGGRAYSRIALGLRRERIEDLAADLVPHFFSSLAANAGLTLHLDMLAGTDDHHVVEAAFKAFARAVRTAVARGEDMRDVLSTKGLL